MFFLHKDSLTNYVLVFLATSNKSYLKSLQSEESVLIAKKQIEIIFFIIIHVTLEL